MEDAGGGLELALSWVAAAAKKSLKNVNGFSPNQLVFWGSPNCRTALNSKLLPLGESSSEVVANNVNAMHTARQAFSVSESGDTIRCALQYQTRTLGDVYYFTSNFFYYKRESNSQWHRPGTVIGQDGTQVLVKHGSVYVLVVNNYSCNRK